MKGAEPIECDQIEITTIDCFVKCLEGQILRGLQVFKVEKQLV